MEADSDLASTFGFMRSGLGNMMTNLSKHVPPTDPVQPPKVHSHNNFSLVQTIKSFGVSKHHPSRRFTKKQLTTIALMHPGLMATAELLDSYLDTMMWQVDGCMQQWGLTRTQLAEARGEVQDLKQENKAATT
jgi:hypothetical protein